MLRKLSMSKLIRSTSIRAMSTSTAVNAIDGTLESKSKAANASDNSLESKTRQLYRGSHALQIRVMGLTGILNTAYWTYYAVNMVINKDVVIQGFDFGGDPRIAFVGVVGTGLIYYSTHVYTSRACCSAWESSDKLRLGFQMHTFFGGTDGRRIEVPRRQARTIQYDATAKTIMLPVYIEGLGKNIVLDRSGTFYEDGELLQELSLNESNYRNPEIAAALQVDSKEKRTEWRKAATRRKK